MDETGGQDYGKDKSCSSRTLKCITYSLHYTSSGLFDVLGKGGMIAWHGDFGHSDILNGTKRGTIIFKYDGESLHTTDAKYFFEHGFEILYGKKVVQLAGPHPDGHDYKYRGSLKPIPKKLLNFLEWSIPDADPAVNTTPAVEDTDSDNESYQKLLSFHRFRW